MRSTTCLPPVPGLMLILTVACSTAASADAGHRHISANSVGEAIPACVAGPMAVRSISSTGEAHLRVAGLPAMPSRCTASARSEADRTFPSILPDDVRRRAHRVAIPRKPRRHALPEDDPDVRQCVVLAAERHDVEATALYLLMDAERGTLGRTSGNTNGTYDIGPMQINSWWLPKLAERGITEDRLTNDLCTNVDAAAWIYALERHAGYSMPEAMARYHSNKPVHQTRYLAILERAIDRRIEQASRQTPIATAYPLK